MNAHRAHRTYRTHGHQARRTITGRKSSPPRRSRMGRAALLGAAVAGTVFAAVTGAQFDITD